MSRRESILATAAWILLATSLVGLGFARPALAQTEHLPGQQQNERRFSNFGIVVEVALRDGTRVRLRDAVLGREDDSSSEGGVLYADSRRLLYSKIRKITVNRITKGLAFGPHALGGGTYGDIEMVDGQVLPNAKMTWQSVFGWERPGRQGKFHDIEAERILYVEFLPY